MDTQLTQFQWTADIYTLSELGCLYTMEDFITFIHNNFEEYDAMYNIEYCEENINTILDGLRNGIKVEDRKDSCFVDIICTNVLKHTDGVMPMKGGVIPYTGGCTVIPMSIRGKRCLLVMDQLNTIAIEGMDYSEVVAYAEFLYWSCSVMVMSYESLREAEPDIKCVMKFRPDVPFSVYMWAKKFYVAYKGYDANDLIRLAEIVVNGELVNEANKTFWAVMDSCAKDITESVVQFYSRFSKDADFSNYSLTNYIEVE